MKTAAIYARVSSDKQREENTIASQTAVLIAFAGEQQFEVPREWIFEDDGYSGASLIRPGLERVRDRGIDPGPPGLRTRPLEPALCASDTVNRGACPRRR